MKTFLFLITMILIGFQSCNSYTPLVTTNAENNQTYKVDYLFEHDGCKVYRFRDESRFVYFTNCTGDVTVANSDSTETKIQTIVRRK